MTTTYSVNWRAGESEAAPGRLEVTADAVVFTPADGAAATEVPLADVPAVHRSASTVELERRSGDPIRIASVTAALLGPRLEAVVELTKTLAMLREEHDRIDAELTQLRTVVDGLPGLSEACRDELVLLATDLMRRIVCHAHVEEQKVYPLVGRMLGGGTLVELMVFDHRAIEGEARDLVRIERGDGARFARVFHRLDAALTIHIAKEEAIVFPLLESR